jgi:hypothetical protein
MLVVSRVVRLPIPAGIKLVLVATRHPEMPKVDMVAQPGMAVVLTVVPLAMVMEEMS